MCLVPMYTITTEKYVTQFSIQQTALENTTNQKINILFVQYKKLSDQKKEKILTFDDI